MSRAGSIIDIETGPLPAEQLAHVKPEFKAPSNYKDPDKIRAYVAEAELAWADKAALQAITGQILAVGLLDDSVHILSGPESGILAAVWNEWALQGRMIGFNIKGFDFMFMYQRSLILGIRPPEDLFQGRYWNNRIIDLQERWCCFNGRTDGQSLDAICKACGMGSKLGTGAHFAELFRLDPQAAMNYLGRDLELTAALAKRLGVL